MQVTNTDSLEPGDTELMAISSNQTGWIPSQIELLDDGLSSNDSGENQGLLDDLAMTPGAPETEIEPGINEDREWQL